MKGYTVDPVTTIDSFKGMLVLGLFGEAFIILIVGLNNNCFGSLGFYVCGFWISLPFVAVYGIAGWAFGSLNGEAILGLTVLLLSNLVVAAPLTVLHYRREPEFYRDIWRSVASKLHLR